jgi:hypothetical protein
MLIPVTTGKVKFSYASAVAVHCTTSVMVLLRTVPIEPGDVAVMTVLPVATLVANPLPLVRPLLIVATFVFDEVQVTAFVMSWLAIPLA